MQQTQTQQPKAMQRQQHAVSKNTYGRDAVLSNKTDEPKMTKARCILRRRCGYLQCVRDGEGGAAVAAPIKQKTNIKTKTKTKTNETRPTQCNKRKLSSRKQCNDNSTLYPKITYNGDAVLSNETDEPKMTKARCILRRRCGFLQCVRDGEGGAAVAAPIKQKTNIKTKTKTKTNETRPTQCNKRKLGSRRQCNDNNTLYPKTLTSEIQYF